MERLPRVSPRTEIQRILRRKKLLGRRIPTPEEEDLEIVFLEDLELPEILETLVPSHWAGFRGTESYIPDWAGWEASPTPWGTQEIE